MKPLKFYSNGAKYVTAVDPSTGSITTMVVIEPDNYEALIREVMSLENRIIILQGLCLILFLVIIYFAV